MNTVVEKSTRQWVGIAMFYVGLSWAKNKDGRLPSAYEVGSSLMLRWYHSYGVPRAQLVESKREDIMWLGYYNIGGRDPFVFDSFIRVNYAIDRSEDIETVNCIVKEYFLGIHIPTCVCGNRFGLKHISGEFYCQGCIDLLQLDTIDGSTKNRKTGYVYIFGSSKVGYYKIGASNRPPSRMQDYQRAKLPFPIEMVHIIPVDNKLEAEASLHKFFESRRTNGEWFKLSNNELNSVLSFTGYQNGHWLR